MMDELARDMMKAKAFKQRDPEFYEAQQELAYKLEWSRRMVDAGRLTKAEFKEFESHLAAEYLAALPMDLFVEMTRDGSYSDLETIAGHDGTRDRHDVLKDRAELNKKITRDALDEALATNKIDAKRYNEEHRAIGTLDDDMTRRVTDAEADNDHVEIALDSLVGRLGSQETAPADMNTFADGLLRDLHGRSNGHVSPPAPAEDGAPKDASED